MICGDDLKLPWIKRVSFKCFGRECDSEWAYFVFFYSGSRIPPGWLSLKASCAWSESASGRLATNKCLNLLLTLPPFALIVLQCLRILLRIVESRSLVVWAFQRLYDWLILFLYENVKCKLNWMRIFVWIVSKPTAFKLIFCIFWYYLFTILFMSSKVK